MIRRTFTQSWSPYAGAVVILLLCLGLMQQGLFWGVFGGLKLWGDHLNSLIGLAPYLGIDSELPDPFLHVISLHWLAGYAQPGTFSTWTSLRRHRSSRHQFYQFAQQKHHQYHFTYFHYHMNKEVKR